MKQYRDVIDAFRKNKPVEQSEKQPEKKPTKPAKPAQAVKNTQQFNINVLTKEDAQKLYREKMIEMQEALNDMIPDANMTPQMQRDYHSARKMEIVTMTKVKVPLYWKCNAYGCCHDQPNECSKPYAGGTWFYEERVVITKEFV